MRLIFVRHAESTANSEGRLQGHEDFSLSDLGQLQSERLFKHFHRQTLKPSHIYSSPLKRAAETAQIVSRSWRLDISYSDDLKEHDIGVFSGLMWDEAVENYPEMASAFEESRDWGVVAGAESVVDQRIRAEKVVHGLINNHNNDDLVIVFTHGGFLIHMISVVMGTERLWSVELKNTALFDFTLDCERWNSRDASFQNDTLWRVNRFADTSHLGEDESTEYQYS